MTIVPVFEVADLADNADRLRIIVARDTQLANRLLDTTLAIDAATGTVTGSFAVVILQSPAVFFVQLEAIRSSDGVVLLRNPPARIEVTAGAGSGGATEVQVVLGAGSYVGPRGVRVAISPKDGAAGLGSTFTYEAVVLDAEDQPVAGVPVSFALVDSATAVNQITLDRLTGSATVAAETSGEVRVYAYTWYGDSDTSRVTLGVAPNSLRVDPGFAAVAAGATQQLSATTVDPQGNPIDAVTANWVSRNAAVATVNSSGQVIAVAPGAATVVATSGTFIDSMLVVVPATGNVVVSSMGDGRAFRSAAVNEDVVVALTADMRFTPAERLGSYNATVTWNPATLQFIDVQNGDFGSQTVNAGNAASGVLRLGSADPNGPAGAVIVALIRFRALAAGTTSAAVTISEMSGTPPTYTNLLSRVTMAGGTVTVRP